MEWMPYVDAPKDGTVIIVAHSDWSGCYFACWGTYQEDENKEGWFCVEGNRMPDEASFHEGDFWIVMPEIVK
jgi:hypothetical protein